MTYAIYAMYEDSTTRGNWVRQLMYVKLGSR